MRKRPFLAIAFAMAALAAAVRLHNAWTFPVLGGYDAFAHFTYVWFLADTGRLPLPHAGWEFFQPPLWYALAALAWNTLAGFDATTRLRVIDAAVALAGLAPAAVAAAAVGRSLPGDRTARLLAAAWILFLPVHLYSAGFLGNEGLTAVACAAAFAALLRTADAPTPARGALLGLALGLAMLAKFTGLVVVAAAVATLGLRAASRRDGAALGALAVALAVAAVVGGWFYARNVALYGTPFRLSRDGLFLARIENSQLQGRREPLEYLLFDPGIVYRPQWPRGLSAHSPRPAGAPYSALRESIPTGLYANAWFDGFGGFVLPPVTASEASRRAGQLLLVLGLLPTATVLVGIAAAVARLRRGPGQPRPDHPRAVPDAAGDRSHDTAVAMLSALAAMAVVLVHGTRTVPTQMAVKATYLMPVAVPFAWAFALGAHEVRRRSERAWKVLLASGAAAAVASVIVFAHGMAIDDAWLRERCASAVVRNLDGVVAYAGGERDSARAAFRDAALAGWHLGYENLAALAWEDGDATAALWLLRSAAARQPAQARGSRGERRQAIADTQAVYANSAAVFLFAMGRHGDARAELATALRLDPTLPEAWWNLGVLDAATALVGDGESRRAGLLAARDSFRQAARLDDAFGEAHAMEAATSRLLGDDAAAKAASVRAARPPSARSWPVETGPGDLLAAGLHRRRRIRDLPPALAGAAAPEARVRPTAP